MKFHLVTLLSTVSQIIIFKTLQIEVGQHAMRGWCHSCGQYGHQVWPMWLVAEVVIQPHCSQFIECSVDSCMVLACFTTLRTAYAVCSLEYRHLQNTGTPMSARP